MTNATHAIIGNDGCWLREATASEVEAWRAGQTHPLFGRHACFDHAVRISETETVELDAGSGLWFGGAGF